MGMSQNVRSKLVNLGGLGSSSCWTFYAVYLSPTQGWTFFFQLTVNGIILGSVYALIALGYTMVYGILKLLNFAHGDVFMVGAFIALRHPQPDRRRLQPGDSGRSRRRADPALHVPAAMTGSGSSGSRSSASPTGRCGTRRGSRR